MATAAHMDDVVEVIAEKLHSPARLPPKDKDASSKDVSDKKSAEAAAGGGGGVDTSGYDPHNSSGTDGNTSEYDSDNKHSGSKTNVTYEFSAPKCWISFSLKLVPG